MALTYTLKASVNNNGTSDTLATGSFTPSNNSLLVVVATGLLVSGRASAPTISNTGTGIGTWTSRLDYWQTNSWASMCAIWTAPVTTGSSSTVTVDFNAGSAGAGDGDGGHSFIVIEFTGHNTTTPVAQVFSDGGTAGRSGAYSGTLGSAPASGNYVITATANDSNSANATQLTPGTAPWTEIYEVIQPVYQANHQYRTGSTSTNVAMQNYNTNGAYSWVIGGIEIAAAATGGWSIVGVGTSVEVTATGHTLTVPAGVAADDLLVACISSRIASTTSITLPTGGEWTLVSEQKANNVLTTGSAVASAMMAYCVRGASDPNLTFTHPAAPAPALGRIVAYRGGAIPTASAKDTQGAATTAISITAVNLAGLTTTAANDLIVAMLAGGQEAAWSVFKSANAPTTASGATDTTTAPSTTTWIERADIQTTTGNDTSLGIFDAVKTAAGATGNFTATASVAASHALVAGAFKIRAAVIAYNMPAAAGSYALTGVAAGVYRGREVLAVAGAYALNGATASLEVGREVVADPGSYVLSGSVASLELGREVLALPASYALTGVVSSLEYGREVVADAGSYALTGTAATITKGAAIVHRTLPAVAGSYALTGGASAATAPSSSLLASYTPGTDRNDFTGEVGVRLGIGTSDIPFNWIGARRHSSAQTGTHTVTLYEWFGDTVVRTATIDFTGVAVGSYAWTAIPAATLLANGYYALLMQVTAFDGQTWCNPGPTTYTGMVNVYDCYRVPASALATGGINSSFIGLDLGAGAAGAGATSLEYGRKVLALGGSYTLTGTATSLEYGREVLAAVGSYALTGAVATFRRTWKATAVSGSYTLAGTPANLLRVGARAIIGLPGSYALSGAAANLEYGREVVAASGSYALTGTATSLEKGLEVAADAGSYTLTGTAASLERGREIAAVSGSYALSGLPANLLKPGAFAIIGLPGSYALTGAAATLTKSELLAAGLVSVWNGSAWVDKSAKVWTGSAWQQKPVKHWNGSAWV